MGTYGFEFYREIDSGAAIRVEGALTKILVGRFSPTSFPKGSSPDSKLSGYHGVYFEEELFHGQPMQGDFAGSELRSDYNCK